MAEPSPLPDSALLSGWDFSTGSVKALALDLRGRVVADIRLPTDLWTEGGVSELNLMQLEGQARAATRGLAAKLRALGRLTDWVAGGVSATHHTSGRIDADNNPVRRAICWNDQTLAKYHAQGLARLGGQGAVKALIGGPWAERYSLSHWVKDEQTLSDADWRATRRILPHGSLAAGYLTGRFDCVSVSAAASTGLMDLRTTRWEPRMLNALADPARRQQVLDSMPAILTANDPVGRLSASLAAECGFEGVGPRVYATLDDQAAGLLGGGAVEAGQVAVILGNSAVVNSSADSPDSGSLDCMRLNWGPYLWMRCYSNGAQFLDRVVGPRPDWAKLEASAATVPPGCGGVTVSPFILSEPSLGVTAPQFGWSPAEPTDPGVRLRAAFEALSYLIAIAVEEHEAAGQAITRVSVSGGIARSDLMLEILASVLNRPLERLESDEGPALGAAVSALAGYGSMTVAEAAARMVRFRDAVRPRREWVGAYRAGLAEFRTRYGRAN